MKLFEVLGTEHCYESEGILVPVWMFRNLLHLASQTSKSAWREAEMNALEGSGRATRTQRQRILIAPELLT